MKSMNTRVQDLERKYSLAAAAAAASSSSNPIATASTSSIVAGSDKDRKVRALYAEVERLTKRVVQLERSNSRSSDSGVLLSADGEGSEDDVGVFSPSVSPPPPPPLPPARNLRTTAKASNAKGPQGNKTTRKRGSDDAQAGPSKKARR